ncbi:MAG: uroporphyrinogen-III synthase [Paracoccaceae bacterium]
MAIQSRALPRALPVLLTRPQPQADRFAAQMAARFGESVAPVISPLLAPRFLTPQIPAGAAALILTSETGVQAAARLRQDGAALPARAFCVGDRTAQAAAQAGFAATSAEGDAGALVALILRLRPEGPLLHLHGEETRGDVAARLSAAGIETLSLCVYGQQAQALSPAATTLLAGRAAVAVPLFSPRSARLFVAVAAGAAAPLHLAAISPAAAAEAAPLARASLVIAARPGAAAMLDALAAILAALPAA